MTDANSARSRRRTHHWRRDLIKAAALFTAVAVADATTNLVVHGPEGPVLLIASAAAPAATAGFHTWWARRHGHAPPGADTGTADTGPPVTRATGSGPGDGPGDGSAARTC